MAQLTEPARFIRERAETARDEGLSEEYFFREFSTRVFARTSERAPSIDAAIHEVKTAGLWPWP